MNIFFKSIPKEGRDVFSVLNEFEKDYLPYCSNFGSMKFLWFPDAWNSVAGIWWAIMSDFLQQNLINQSFCSPSATLMEINVINRLRELVGYEVKKIENNLDIWWIITYWWTISNIIWILMARENKFPWSLEKSIKGVWSAYLVVPKGIGHYSVKSAQMLLWLWYNLLEVKTKEYKYDLVELEKVLKENKGNIFWLVAYAWDSRTMSIDNFSDIYDLVKKIDPTIWLHADACHGFSLWYSTSLKNKIVWIEKFDSITGDPHKVFNLPYTISMLLIKNPNNIKKVLTISDLIMNEWLALWQMTPFIGSKSWLSLKLWFFMKNIWLDWWNKLINNRHNVAKCFSNKLKNNGKFVVINNVEINSVMFMYVWKYKWNLENINKINQFIYKSILNEGEYYIHSFPIHDDIGNIEKWAKIYPLRFMSWNPLLDENHLDIFIKYIESIVKKYNLNHEKWIM